VQARRLGQSFGATCTEWYGPSLVPFQFRKKEQGSQEVTSYLERFIEIRYFEEISRGKMSLLGYLVPFFRIQKGNK
jgi:hypothetical protein